MDEFNPQNWYLMNINETPVSIVDLRATFSYLVHI